MSGPAMSTSTNSDLYDGHFYAAQQARSHESAMIILQRLFDLWRPASIVDFGCGVGAWLKAAERLGLSDLVGLDGHWVVQSAFEGTRISFSETNLEVPVRLERRFDLAISVEVAEHLPPERADGFVHDLCTAADVVLFGAAVPLQGGTQHINEQFQSYWATRFDRMGYQAIDMVRPFVWQDDRVDWWYRQNTLLYVNRDIMHQFPEALRNYSSLPEMLDVVHPDLLGQLAAKLQRPSARFVATLAGRALRRLTGPAAGGGSA